MWLRKLNMPLPVQAAAGCHRDTFWVMVYCDVRHCGQMTMHEITSRRADTLSNRSHG
jgi:hypothetical protein